MTSNIAARLRIAGERTDNRAFNNMETLCRQAVDEIERLGETLVIVKQVAAEDFAEHDKKIGKLQADIELLRAALKRIIYVCEPHSIVSDIARKALEAAPRDETTRRECPVSTDGWHYYPGVPIPFRLQHRYKP